jgi:predicted membrane protein
MLLTPHVLVGMVVAKAVPNPIIAPILSVIMHFLGDLFPHWDFYSFTTREERLRGWRPIAVMADFGLGIAVGTAFTLHALWVQNNPALAVRCFICGIASVLPDALEAPHIFTNKKYIFIEKLANVQKQLQTQAPIPWGILTQILVIVFSLLLIL